ncbi:MAG: (2Fe-2S) ferredoxin domain-containing protein [Oscillospiraceae bacterium]|nr:(2Fe-2S) ferredoxin domain-containing protein [Oscillospiraceae bacterium]MDD4367830.1 (2Fe-2S) ferredoxin domain-containing protein [Oscillospiraceae bacterium]
MVQTKYHVFICTSCTLNGQQRGFCAKSGSPQLVQKLMEELEDRGLTADVMVNNTGCFGICNRGPIMVVYPEGVWYGNLDEQAIEAICEEHLEGGRPVERLRI